MIIYEYNIFSPNIKINIKDRERNQRIFAIKKLIEQ